MALALTDTQNYSDIADAIRAKAGTEDTFAPSEMAQAIADMPSGGADPYPVRNDGKTHLWVRRAGPHQEPLTVRLTQSAASGVSVDWGDGSAPEANAASGEVTFEHDYASASIYEVVLSVVSGEASFVQPGNNPYSFMRRADGGNQTSPYSLLAAELCGISSIGASSFYIMYSLTSLVVHGNASISGGYVTYGCYALRKLALSEHVSIDAENAFNSSNGLLSLTLPADMTNIRGYTFRYCYALSEVAIPASVTTIGAEAFGSCSSLTKVTFFGTPASVASNAFSSDWAIANIYVPWSEGEVANAPWGADNATVHYDWAG